MTIKEFMEIQIDGDDIISVYDYEQDKTIFEGWYSDFDYDYEIESWEITFNERYNKQIICFNVDTTN